MSKRQYKWRIYDELPAIEPHSKNKHSIYAGYLSRYIAKLTQNPKHPSFQLFIVDGFCGGGIYKDSDGSEHLGSPFIVFNAVNEALIKARENRTSPLTANLRYYFVDKDQQTLTYLQHEHKARGINTDTNYPVQYICQEFNSAYTKIVGDIKQQAPRTQRALFFLDQYGWSAVDFEVVNCIANQLSNAEFILTFSVDDLRDKLSNDPNKAAPIAKTLQSIGLEITPVDILSRLDDHNYPANNLVAQEYVASTIKEKSTLKYFTRYYIKRTSTHRSMMLIHLSNHMIAHDEMMQEHWENSNFNFNHQGYAGVAPVLGYNLQYDGQFSYFDERFFEENKESVVNAMIYQVPVILSCYEMGLPFEGLLDKISNNAPITIKIMKQVCSELLNHKVIKVINHKTGKARRSSGKIHLQDQIKMPHQRAFLFRNG